jgi:Zn-dependent peptidase ImmA (M78 family)
VDINRRVHNLITRHKTNCPFQIAKQLNIDIWYLNLGDSCRGYYLRTLRRRYIALNESLSEEWQRFVCAHELGHDRLHSGMMGYYFIEQHTLFNPGKHERQANSFAVKLLLGRDRPEQDDSLEHYFMRNGVPIEMRDYF